MKQREFKLYAVRIQGDGSRVSISRNDVRFSGDPFAYARMTVKSVPMYDTALDTLCEVVEMWNHKAGRRWIMTDTVLGSWTLEELTLGDRLEALEEQAR